MSKDCKQLKKLYKNLIEDIFDNFDSYTDDEKRRVKEELSHLEALNSILEKYDVKKSKSLFEMIAECFRNATGKK